MMLLRSSDRGRRFARNLPGRSAMPVLIVGVLFVGLVAAGGMAIQKQRKAAAEKEREKAVQAEKEAKRAERKTKDRNKATPTPIPVPVGPVQPGLTVPSSVKEWEEKENEKLGKPAAELSGDQANLAAKLEKTRQQFHAINRALDDYYLDYMAFPPTAGMPEIPDPIRVLQEPRAYLELKTFDPFAKDETTQIKYYYDGTGWMIWSMGPDGDYDLNGPEYKSENTKNTWQEQIPILAQWTFDPTNGVVSNGDVWRIKR